MNEVKKREAVQQLLALIVDLFLWSHEDVCFVESIQFLSFHITLASIVLGIQCE